MAIAALRRIPLYLTRSPPSISLLSTSIARPCSSIARAAPSASAKVADRIVKVFAIDLNGKKREVVGLSGQTLLRALMNAGLIDPDSHRLEEIDACSAECEVHIAQEWLDKLPPPSYDEKYLLTRTSRNRVLNKHARLGCQVVLTPELQAVFGISWIINWNLGRLILEI
ncbi:ferredoxin-2, mitochondrial-like [Phoenix dactylifera]|uniref:Ferredoxin-2, mitochondrial-like n=1 Tax=Phoenix dactylifera TaxID=42345 RepID=A0A8B7C303_PHODC|nr:ferredoxin-2, mitochondrial-like [Phoenix dactylifera]